MKFILTDTCYWIGLLDNRDQHHEDSQIISDLIEGHNLAFPWPCLYETISTYLIRRKDRIRLFEQIIKSNKIQFIDDAEYREQALAKVFEVNSNTDGYSHSLVDAIMREMLNDINLKIDYLVTFNKKDFIDICSQRGIKMLPDEE
jgi:predicted nucleic acid-binding protein